MVHVILFLFLNLWFFVVFFFFQAEDGIRDRNVTGVQTCALPISHASYGACGLGSNGTDRLVELVVEAGPERGLFGAKITGGGSGGTVAVLGTSEAEAVVREVATRYGAESRRQATVFTDSGPGAAETGVLMLAPDELSS